LKVDKLVDRYAKDISDRCDDILNGNTYDNDLEEDEENALYLKGATLPRDFELEERFTRMAEQRAIDYSKRYYELLDKGEEFVSNMTCPGLDTSYYNRTQEEKDYYFNKDRFPDPVPLYDREHPPSPNVNKSSFQYGLWCEKYNPEHPNCGCEMKF
jgi:hypothetical protein